MTSRRRSLLLDRPRRACDALRQLANNDDAAIREGRLFVERQRVTEEQQLLAAGHTVTLHAPRKNITPIAKRPGIATAPSFEPSPTELLENVPRVLGRRDGLLAVYKPAAWSSEPDQTGVELCLSHYLSQQLKLRNLHVATRLDVGVSGLVLVATDVESRRHLALLVEQGKLHRVYLAIAFGKVPPQGQWKGSVESKPQDKQREAITNYECLAQVRLVDGIGLGGDPKNQAASLLRFSPQTGRRHQLRIHAARHGHPLFGDRRYGGPKQVVLTDGRVFPLSRILLQAIATELPLPNGETWSIHCPVDEEVGRFWKLLGGTDVDVTK